MTAKVTVVFRQAVNCMNFFEVAKAEGWKEVTDMARNKM